MIKLDAIKSCSRASARSPGLIYVLAEKARKIPGLDLSHFYIVADKARTRSPGLICDFSINRKSPMGLFSFYNN
jgi:hypothetical protein